VDGAAAAAGGGAHGAPVRGRGGRPGCGRDLTKIAGLPEAEADRYAARIHTLLAWLEAGATQQPDLSVKLSALTPRFDPIDLDGSVERVLVRLEPIRTAAAQAGSEDTLRQFVWSRVVSSNQLRHGYVPDLGGQIS
jgi:hypothetical protein